MISVSIANNQDAVEVAFPILKAAARAVLEGEGVASAKVTLAFFDDAAIHALNKRHLGHDEPTDVLTFPYSGPKAAKLEGDIAIGASVGQRRATEDGHDVTAELALYVIHACLHLCGYDDRSPKDTKQMRAKERFYLKACGHPDIAEPA